MQICKTPTGLLKQTASGMRFAAVRTAGRSVRGLHITAITAAVRTQPLPAPFVTAARRVDALTEVVITVETDEGFSGMQQHCP